MPTAIPTNPNLQQMSQLAAACNQLSQLIQQSIQGYNDPITGNLVIPVQFSAEQSSFLTAQITNLLTQIQQIMQSIGYL